MRLRSLSSLAVYAALSVFTALAAYWQTFTTFAPYDDEGYLLLSLRSFEHGGALYNDVFSEYGPFFHEFWAGLFKVIGQDITPDAGRIAVIVVWVVASVVLGVAVQRLTGELALGVAAQLGAFSLENALTSEPMHPGGLILVLLSLAVLIVSAREPRKPRMTFLALGLVIGGLLMIKVNVGGFALIALVFSVFMTSRLVTKKRTRMVVVAIFAAIPFILMWRDLGTAWAQNYAVLVGGAGLALGVVVIRSQAPANLAMAPTARVVPPLLAGLVGAVVVASGVIVVLGTTARALVDGVVINPIHHPGVVTNPLQLPDASIEWALLGVVGAIVAAEISSRSVRREPSLTLSLVRVVSGLVILLSITQTSPVTLAPPSFPFGLALPLAWLAAGPRPWPAGSPIPPFARIFIPALAIMQSLHAYPVAGSQVEWSQFLFVPVATICLSDGWVGLRNLARGQPAESALPILSSLAVPLAVGVSIFVFVVNRVDRPMDNARTTYNADYPLPFPGATKIRLPQPVTASYVLITHLLNEQCSQFLTLPGLDSFYLWSGKEPPTDLNVPGWMFALNSAEQQRIVNRVRGVKRLCLLRNSKELRGRTGARPIPSRPLITFENNTFKHRIAQIGGYEILLRTDTPRLSHARDQGHSAVELPPPPPARELVPPSHVLLLRVEQLQAG